MKKTLYVVIICLMSNLAFGQKISYFDRTFHYKNDDSKRDNRRVYIVKDSIIEIKDYRKTDLFRVGIFYGFSDLDNLDEYIYFLSIKDVDRNPELITDNRGGAIRKYFNNLIIEQLWIEEKVLFSQVWSNGKEILYKGTGKFENKSSLYEETGVSVIKDSVQVEGYIVRERKRDTIYSILDTRAYPKLNIEQFYNQLAKTIDYGKLSKKLEIKKDKIWLQFVVDKDGQLTDFFALNNKGFKFSKKDIKKMESMPKWEPATFNGKAVKTRIFFPLTFQPDLIKHYLTLNTDR